MWFEELTGFPEESAEQVQANLTIRGDRIESLANGKSWKHGTLLLPSLAELRDQVRNAPQLQGQLKLSEVVADVQQLHQTAANQGALFQVASQFNLLEMVSPRITPEHGIDIYDRDRTQGPACAIACGAGTIYRNYFVELDGQIGQSANKQVDCLRDIGEALGNGNGDLWTMQNGYALATKGGLAEISRRLGASSESEFDVLRGELRVGYQRETEVTLDGSGHCVTQAYCSALPVAYSSHSEDRWADFAKLVLQAAYEATLAIAVLNHLDSGNNRVYLTLLGGGAFGNRAEWILGAIERAARLYRDKDLDIAIVSYGGSKRPVRELVDRWS